MYWILRLEGKGAADAARYSMAQSGQPRPIPEARRDGMMFVLSPDSPLPCRCLKCNAETGGFRISRKISTLSPWYPLFSSAGWNAHCVDDRPIHIAFSLCPRHRLQWLWRLMLIGLIVVANVFCLAIHMVAPHLGATIDVLTIILPVILLAVTLTLRPMLRPRRVYHGLAWFAGAGREFLDSLPELNAPPSERSDIALA